MHALGGVNGIRPRKGAPNRGNQGQHNDESREFDPSMYQRFSESFDRHRQQLIKERVASFYGKNYVVDYQERFGFEEEWEEKTTTSNMGFSLGIPSSRLEELFCLLLYLFLVASSFTTTIDYFFKTGGSRQMYKTVYSITIASLAIDAGIRLNSYLKSRAEAYYSKLEMCREIAMQATVICYFLLKMVDLPQRMNVVWAGCELVITVLLIYRIRQIEKAYRFLRFLLNLENQAKILELYIGLMLILHLMATILMCSTYPYPEDNWLSSLSNIDMRNEFSVYLRAFYFATTTILTVGYGDISPKNDLEIAVVTLIEMIGIIVFAYMINEIGYAMSNLRKETEIVDKDLSNVEKIKQHYNMKDDTINRLRTFVINQKPTGRLIEPEEERRLMSKLNEDLRKDVQKLNYLSILKTSMFFLLRWSKSFQKVIANRLTHILFSPEELLYQPEGKERIYIIRVGKINIYAERSKLRRGANNVLKAITAELGKQTFDNTYGWTAVLSRRPSRLYAYAKGYASTYCIDKTQFSQAIKEASTDFEYYHELKDRLDQSPCWEALELPVLESSRHHYNPTRLIIVKRDQEGSMRNRRKHEARRTGKTGSKWLIRNHQQIDKVRRKFTVILSAGYLSLRDIDNYHEDTPIEASEKFLIYGDSDKVVPTKDEEEEEVLAMEAKFETGKDYSNYFERHNQTQILKKLERANFVYSKKFKEELNKSFSQFKRVKMANLEDEDDE